MALSRKERVLQKVKQNTLQLIHGGNLANNGIDASRISKELQLDRANVSKELNNLWHEGKLIKIQGKPILFIDYNELIKSYPGKFIPLTISTNDVLTSYIESPAPEDSIPSMNSAYFDTASIIGAKWSLFDQIDKAKAAVAYPPNGLHMLLIGNPGTGKIEFVNHIFEYAVQHGIKQSDSRLIVLNCQNYAHSHQLLSQQLFGCSKYASNFGKAIKGLIEQCSGGIIFFDGIHNLSPQSLDIVLRLIEKSSYSRIGETALRPLNATLVASTFESQASDFIGLLQYHMPVVIHIPDIDKTSVYEKIQLILDVFSKESKNIRHNIRIHKDIILCFTAMTYPENRTQLINEVKVVCSKALMSTALNNTDTVNIGYQHLSQNMLSSSQDNWPVKEKVTEILSIVPNDYIIFNSNGTSTTINYLKNPPKSYDKIFVSPFMNVFQSDLEKVEEMESYIEKAISSLMLCDSAQLAALHKTVQPHLSQIVVQQLRQDRQYEMLLKQKRVLLGLLFHLTDIINRPSSSDIVHNQNCLKASRAVTPEGHKTEKNIINTLHSIFGIKFSQKESDFIKAYLSTASRIVNKARVSIMVICHGDSTATDMIKCLKGYADENLEIAGINFGYSTNLDELLMLALAKGKEINRGAGIAVLVDMEPLLSVSDYIYQKTGIETRTLAPVTLKGLLETAKKCVAGYSLHELTPLPPSDYSRSSKEGCLKHSDFITRFISEVLTNSLSFINPQKAVVNLITALNNILKELTINYSNEIAVKFLSHCAHMLERTIKNDTLSYVKLKQFTNENYRLMSIIEKHLTSAANTFGVTIPSSEIAYVAEIFINYMG